jgi:Cu+-exporting ATPase
MSLGSLEVFLADCLKPSVKKPITFRAKLHLMSNQFVDPVRGMRVNPANRAGSFEHKGTTYHFCSVRCLDKFKSDADNSLTLEKPQESVAKGHVPSAPAAGASLHTCPMHPEIRQDHPGVCRKCGMPLERLTPIQLLSKTEYVCPMHQQIIRSEPGNCPICGMTLEPRDVSADYQPSPELADMTRRFWIGVALTVPLMLIEMSDMIPGRPLQHAMPALRRTWVELTLATPVVLWAGWQLFVRGWASIVNRSLNIP